METYKLKTIIEIAEAGSLSKASKKLYIAQSSLSNFLKKYEDILGYKLFIRTSKGIFPTAEGKIFLIYAKNAIEQKKILLDNLSDVSNLKMGSIRFSISPYRAPYLIPLLLVSWKKLYPNINVEIIEANVPAQEEMLMQNTVDLAFLIKKNTEKNLVYRDIMEEEILIGAHSSFGLKRKAYQIENSDRCYVEIEDIKNKPYLLYSVNHSLNKFAISFFKEYQLKPNVVQIQDNFETILKLSEKGMGITFVPYTYTEFNKNLEYYSIGYKGQYRTLVLGYPPSGYLSNATKAFSDLIIELLSNNS